MYASFLQYCIASCGHEVDDDTGMKREGTCLGMNLPSTCAFALQV